MAGGGFTGTPDDFQKAYSDVSEIKGQIDGNLNTLRNNIEATRAGWSGDAGNLFQKVMDRYNEKAMACSQALDDIAHMLQQSGQTYAEAEAAQQDQINKISNALG